MFGSCTPHFSLEIHAIWQYNENTNRGFFMQRNAFIRTRTDAQLKEQAEMVLSRLGLNLTDAINLFLVQVTLHNAIPFSISIPDSDPDFSKSKQAAFEERKKRLNDAIAEGEADFKAGRFYTAEESRARTRATLESLKQQHGIS